jgi:hypothetical protein
MDARFLGLLMLAASLSLSATGCANPLNLGSFFGAGGLPSQEEPDVVTEDSDDDITTDVGDESD